MSAIEEWRPVVGFEGRYEVSNLGRVASLPNQRRHSRILLSLAVAHKRGGYHFVGLRNGGGEPRKMRKVHQLVCEAFDGPRPDGAVVRHLDGEPTNNHADNLAWGTPAENTQDMIRHGRHLPTEQTHCKRGHPLFGENVYINATSGSRQCKACRRLNRRKSRESQEAEKGFPQTIGQIFAGWMATADGCACGNLQPPKVVIPSAMPGMEFHAYYRCGDCGNTWTRAYPPRKEAVA